MPPAARRELLELAWQAADLAREPLPLSAKFSSVDSREAVALHYQKRAVDALSIRLDVVERFLETDSQEALVRFQSIALPRSEASGCAEAMAADYSRYYRVASNLLSRAFSLRDRERGNDMAFARKLASNLPGVLALAPWLQVLAGPGLTPSARQDLLNISIPALMAAPVSDRDLAIAESRDRLLGRLESVIASASAAGGLAGLYRHALGRVFAQPVCADSAVADERGTSAIDKRISFFNGVLRPFASPPAALNRADFRIEVSRVAARTTPLPSIRFLHLLDDLTAYRHGLRAVAPARRAGVNLETWEIGVTEFLHRLDDWKPEPEATLTERAALFHQRASFYLYLLDLLPSGNLERRTVDRMVALLETDEIKDQSPTEWMGKLGALLMLTRRPGPAEQTRIDDLKKSGKILIMLPREDPAAILERLRKSRDRELAMYAEFEDKYPVPYRFPG
ncbi:MAG: hypothetical protein K2X35_20110 [Bryobacteraceae bacterium]|nr:hypothetical protein [Bryobacteraceae bacterium]